MISLFQKNKLQFPGKSVFLPHFVIVGGLAIVAVMLRWWKFELLGRYARDAYGYFTTAEYLLETGDWTSVFKMAEYCNMPPGYLQYLMFAKQCGLPFVAGAMLINIVASLVLTGMVYVIIREVTEDKRFALVGALIAATDPYLIKLSCQLLRDVPYYACVMMVVACGILAIRRKQLLWWIPAMLASMGALLLRKEGIETLMIPAFWGGLSLLYFGWKREWKTLSLNVLITVSFISIVLAVLFPMRNYYVNNYGSAWEIIPHTWAGYIWSMFRSMIKA